MTPYHIHLDSLEDVKEVLIQYCDYLIYDYPCVLIVANEFSLDTLKPNIDFMRVKYFRVGNADAIDSLFCGSHYDFVFVCGFDLLTFTQQQEIKMYVAIAQSGILLIDIN